MTYMNGTWLSSPELRTLGLLFVLLGACNDDPPSNEPDARAGDADASVDAGRLDAGVPSGALPCDDDGDCEDGIACTMDACDPRGFCRNQIDPASCQDGVFCNGAELCDPERGCVPGDTPCNDGDVCTIPQCDEEAKTCLQLPRDNDEDGEADWHCAGGTDCDDFDPTRGSTFNEICGDSLDNDCDSMVDEPDCGRPQHDVCEDALDVSEGGLFVLSTNGAAPDYDTECGGTRRDIVVSFVIEDAPKDVTLRASGESLTTVELRAGVCEDADARVECGQGFPGQVRRRGLEPGAYFAVVSDSLAGDLALEVVIEEATAPPTNQTCASPADITGGGAFSGDFVDISDDLSVECADRGAGDLVYSFQLDAPQNVSLSAISATGDPLAFEIRTTCEDPTTALRCQSGSSASGFYYSLPVGLYYVVVEAAEGAETDFDLRLDLLPPTPAPPGDTCEAAIDLPFATTVVGTLSDKQDDYPTACGFDYRDSVYRFELAEPQDVQVSVDGAGTNMRLSLREAVCDDIDARLRCESGRPAEARFRNLPAGEYFVVVESFQAVDFGIELEVSPPTPATPVAGNDTCESAHVIPPTGGVFSGSTALALNDYSTAAGCGSMATSADVAYRLDLATRRRVIASTEGSAFDTVLHIHSGMCVSEGEVSCDEDGGRGLTSRINVVLQAGTHYIVVDGFGMSSAGSYELGVEVTSP